MRHPRIYMARTRPTWLLWMALLTIPYVLLHVAQILWDAFRQVRATWHWQYKYEWQEWFGYFSEKHRATFHSLAARPERAGTIVRGPERLQ